MDARRCSPHFGCGKTRAATSLTPRPRPGEASEEVAVRAETNNQVAITEACGPLSPSGMTTPVKFCRVKVTSHPFGTLCFFPLRRLFFGMTRSAGSRRVCVLEFRSTKHFMRLAFAPF